MSFNVRLFPAFASVCLLASLSASTRSANAQNPQQVHPITSLPLPPDEDTATPAAKPAATPRVAAAPAPKPSLKPLTRAQKRAAAREAKKAADTAAREEASRKAAARRAAKAAAKPPVVTAPAPAIEPAPEAAAPDEAKPVAPKSVAPKSVVPKPVVPTAGRKQRGAKPAPAPKPEPMTRPAPVVKPEPAVETAPAPGSVHAIHLPPPPDEEPMSTPAPVKTAPVKVAPPTPSPATPKPVEPKPVELKPAPKTKTPPKKEPKVEPAARPEAVKPVPVVKPAINSEVPSAPKPEVPSAPKPEVPSAPKPEVPSATAAETPKLVETLPATKPTETKPTETVTPAPKPEAVKPTRQPVTHTPALIVAPTLKPETPKPIDTTPAPTKRPPVAPVEVPSTATPSATVSKPKTVTVPSSIVPDDEPPPPAPVVSAPKPAKPAPATKPVPELKPRTGSAPTPPNSSVVAPPRSGVLAAEPTPAPVAAPAPPPPPPGTLGRIIFQGAAPFTDADLAPLTGLQLGTKPTDDSLQTASTRLIGTGLFSNVKASYDTPNDVGTATFVLQPLPASQLARVSFANIVWLTPAEIESTVKALPLYRGVIPMSGNVAMADSIQAALQSALSTRGVDATLTHTLIPPSPQHPYPAMEFRVTSPNVVLASASLFDIPPALVNRTLRAQTDAVKVPYNDGIAGTTLSDLLLAPARNAGYIGAKLWHIERKRHVINRSTVSVDFVARMDAGPIYSVHSLHWTPTEVLSEADFRKQAALHVGQVPTTAAADQTEAVISNAYAAQGYLEANINARQDLDPKTGAADYYYTAVAGPQYRLGHITVRGLSPQAQQDFDAAWTMKPGDVYNEGALLSFLTAHQNIPSLKGYTFTYDRSTAPDTHLVDLTLTFKK